MNLANDEEPEEAVMEEEATPIVPPSTNGFVRPSTDVYECVDEYCRISEEAEGYLSEVDCYRKMIRVDIEDYASAGLTWQ